MKRPYRNALGLLADWPELVAQFDWEGNPGITPEMVTAGTYVKLAWKCGVAHDHRWRTSGAVRMTGSGCPFCANKRPSVTNSLAAPQHAHLASEYDVDGNGGLAREQVMAGTSKKLMWSCPIAPDHKWRASGASRVAGSGCPYCAGVRVSETNNLATVAELAAQFDRERNGGLDPKNVFLRSSKHFAWSCPWGPDHRWEASAANRAGGTGCPFCAGHQPSVTNSLASPRFAHLAAQFEPALNDNKSPSEFVAGTAMMIGWRCPEGPDHTWRAAGASRVLGAGCPACSGKQPSVTNSLAQARHAHLAAEFDLERNGGQTPASVIAWTSKKIHWICTITPDHRWQATGSARVSGSGCPQCVLSQHSEREIRLAAELATVIPLDISAHRIQRSSGRPFDVDIVSPECQLVVEYDGAYFHRTESHYKRDAAKTSELESLGFTVVRVRERPLLAIGAHDVSSIPSAPIHLVAADVLDKIAQVMPTAVSGRNADAYRGEGRAMGSVLAEWRLRELRTTQAQRRERKRARTEPPLVD